MWKIYNDFFKTFKTIFLEVLKGAIPIDIPVYMNYMNYALLSGPTLGSWFEQTFSYMFYQNGFWKDLENNLSINFHVRKIKTFIVASSSEVTEELTLLYYASTEVLDNLSKWFLT